LKAREPRAYAGRRPTWGGLLVAILLRTALVSLVLATVSFASASQAAMIGYSTTINANLSAQHFGLPPSSGANTDFYDIRGLQPFDPALGTLLEQEVSVQITYNRHEYLGAANPDGQGLFEAQGDVDFLIVDPLTSNEFTLQDRRSLSCTMIPDAFGSFSCEVERNLQSVVLSGSWTNFVGVPEQLYLTVRGRLLSSEVPFSQAFIDVGAVFNAVVRVTYTYEPVPEPGTAMLVLLGIVGLAAARRARTPEA
jgi:hypothetical protein